LIVYRKAGPPRIKRSTVPEPPWWFATAIAPYGSRRAMPVAVDYLDLRASAPERMEVTVAADVRDDLERSTARVSAPVLIEASERAEVVFRRGNAALGLLREWDVASSLLISTHGEIHENAERTIVAAWPLDLEALEIHASSLRGRAWGFAVPIMFPATTDLAQLDRLCRIASENGAEFVAAIPVEMDATAKHALARSLTLPDDEETYQHLFHSDLEPVHVATERHIAALAHAAGMHDFVVPPMWDELSNWNAAIVLSLTATRMLAMHSDTEVAGAIARSARLVAELDKPIVRIAEAAPLTIIGALDPTSIAILNDWAASRRSPFVDRVNQRWRLRRDAGV
jgi:hypothetical protein